MSEKTITLENIELTKNKIIQLLEQLTIDYQNSAKERKKSAVDFIPSEDEFSVVEEIELLTTDIRGYAAQIKARGKVNDQAIVISKLKKMRIFDIPNIRRFYFNNQINFPLIKGYLRMLDYLRLLILEYLSLPQNS
jgi:hypothetical protein